MHCGRVCNKENNYSRYEKANNETEYYKVKDIDGNEYLIDKKLIICNTCHYKNYPIGNTQCIYRKNIPCEYYIFDKIYAMIYKNNCFAYKNEELIDEINRLIKIN